MTEMHPDIQYRAFVVGQVSYCAWGWDLEERNRVFIEQIDAEYFEYVCGAHVEHLGGSDAQRAAIAIRSSYHLALETLFSLIGAVLQAPDCIPGWILKASTGDVREIAKQLLDGRMSVARWSSASSSASFFDLANLIFQYTAWASANGDQTVDEFGHLWARLAQDFLNAYSIKEYNSIKHGFRARPGGFSIRIGRQTSRGEPPSEEMKDLGGSRFGTNFFSAEPIQDAPKVKNDPNFMLQRNSINWFPENNAGRLSLVVMSIQNIKSFLLCALGAEPGTMKFYRPNDSANYRAAWQKSPGVVSANFDQIVSEQSIGRFQRSELDELLNSSKKSSG